MKKYLILATIGLITSALIIYLIMNILLGSYTEVKTETAFSIEVLKIKKYKGFLYLNDSIKISPLCAQIELKCIDLYDYIKIGDKLSKKINDNTIILAREDKNYFFQPFSSH